MKYICEWLTWNRSDTCVDYRCDPCKTAEDAVARFDGLYRYAIKARAVSINDNGKRFYLAQIDNANWPRTGDGERWRPLPVYTTAPKGK